MLKILQFQETEGETLRDMLRDNHGVVCELVQAPFRVPTEDGPDAACSIYRYHRPSSGAPVWIIELDFVLPDGFLTRSWIIDQPPTWKEVNLIITNNAQARSCIQSDEGI